MNLDSIKQDIPQNDCTPALYKNGVHVGTLHSLRSWYIEAWVQEVARISGKPVDWHFFGGRACLRVLKRHIPVVLKTMKEQAPLLREMYLHQLEKNKEEPVCDSFNLGHLFGFDGEGETSLNFVLPEEFVTRNISDDFPLVSELLKTGGTS
jgi:hypothetical protein